MNLEEKIQYWTTAYKITFCTISAKTKNTSPKSTVKICKGSMNQATNSSTPYPEIPNSAESTVANTAM